MKEMNVELAISLSDHVEQGIFGWSDMYRYDNNSQSVRNMSHTKKYRNVDKKGL